MAYAQTATFDSLYARAQNLVQYGLYAQADTLLTRAAPLRSPLPDDFSYFFGVTSFHQGRQPQAERFLKKYLELTQNKGYYADDARRYLRIIQGVMLAEDSVIFITLTDTCPKCLGAGELDDSCLACHGHKVVLCPQCLGQKQITVKEKMGTWFKPCPRCQAKGSLPCPTCGGTGHTHHTCPKCNGKGTIQNVIRKVIKKPNSE